MQALQHIMEGDLEKARKILADVPEIGPEDILRQIRAGAETLSDLAREEQGNRAQRRAAAKARR